MLGGDVVDELLEDGSTIISWWLEGDKCVNKSCNHATTVDYEIVFYDLPGLTFMLICTGNGLSDLADGGELRNFCLLL